MNDYKELIEMLRDMSRAIIRDDSIALGIAEELITDVDADACNDAADAIEQLLHERFLIGEILVTESKWELEPETACEQIRRVLRGE